MAASVFKSTRAVDSTQLLSASAWNGDKDVLGWVALTPHFWLSPSYAQMCEEGPAALAGGLRFCPLILDGILTAGEIPCFCLPGSPVAAVSARRPAGTQRVGAAAGPSAGAVRPPRAVRARRGLFRLATPAGPQAAGSPAGGCRPLGRACGTGKGLPSQPAMKAAALWAGALLSSLLRSPPAPSPRPPSGGGRAPRPAPSETEKEPGGRAAAKGLLITLPDIGEEAAAEGDEAAGSPQLPT